MNKAADKPLYRQLTPTLAAIFLFVILLLPLALALVYLSERQQASGQQEQLHQLQQQNQYLQYLQKNQSLFTQLLSQHQGGQFSHLYQRLLDNWQSLAEQLPHGGQSTALALGSSALSEEAERLAAGSKRNLQLKQQSLIQLQLVADALDAIILSKQGQLALLDQQLQPDEVGDAVTASRARAQGNIYRQLARYYRLENLLVRLQLLFADLDLQLSLSDFEILRSRADEVLRFAGELKELEQQDIQLMTLADEVDKLSALLLSGQRTLAKWQGHLRLAHEFRQSLAADRQTIQVLLASHPLPAVRGGEASVLTGISARLSDFSRGQVLLFAVCLSAVLATMVLLLLIRLHLRLKAHSRLSHALCEQLAVGEQADEHLVNTLENSRFARLIGQLKKPALTAQEVKRLTLGYRMQLKTLAQLNQVIYWQQDGEFPLSRQLNRASKYLFRQAITLGSWRHAFPREEVKRITAAARKVHESGHRRHIRVFNHSGELLAISLLYRDHHFCGTVINAGIIDGYERKLALLHQEHEEQQQARQQLAKQEYRQLDHLLTVAGLQVQSLSSGGAVTPRQLYRQLARASEWLSRHQLLSGLREKQLVMSLQDVHPVNEIHAAAYNLMPRAKQQQNRLVLDCDPCLLSRAKLDVRLFHELLYTLGRILLTGIFNGQLSLAFKVKDKQPEQQVVQVCAGVSCGQKFARLPAILELLIADEKTEKGLESNGLSEYLRLLLAYQHGSNLTAELTGQGYRLMFELPLTQAGSGELVAEHADTSELTDLSLVFLAGQQEEQDMLRHLLKPVKLDCYCASDKLLARLAHEQLKSRPVDVVMISREMLAKEKAAIDVHLETLPDALRPDLMVLQSEPSQVHESGFYSPAGDLLSQQNLHGQIRDLIRREGKTNLLFTPSLCRQYAFARTEVEVLLGVKEPGKYQTLISLLHWLGLQVHLSANSETMRQLWQSGRFLLLVTEFELPDFIDLDQGRAFERGVFSLPGGNSLADKTEVKGWLQADFPALADLPGVVSLLKPWLKCKEEEVKEQNQLPDKELQQPAAALVKVQGAEIDPGDMAPDLPELQALALQEQLASLSGSETEVPAAFDLLAYTRHQSSPELAAYMLEQYLADNRDYLAQLRGAFQSRHFQQAEKMLALLQQNAVILAADNLLALCRQMQALTGQKGLQQADALLDKTRQELEAIENYAESI